jgi:hypothetical protein
MISSSYSVADKSWSRGQVTQRISLPQSRLQPLRRLLQLTLQTLNLLRNLLELLFRQQTGSRYLMCLTIRLPHRPPNSNRHPRQPVFPSHHALQKIAAIVNHKPNAAKLRLAYVQLWTLRSAALQRGVLDKCRGRPAGALTHFLVQQVGGVRFYQLRAVSAADCGSESLGALAHPPIPRELREVQPPGLGDHKQQPGTLQEPWKSQ